MTTPPKEKRLALAEAGAESRVIVTLPKHNNNNK